MTSENPNPELKESEEQIKECEEKEQEDFEERWKKFRKKYLTRKCINSDK